ncbi:hypothetical protein QOT17_022652 [Balamuthia mandrillaris]
MVQDESQDAQLVDDGTHVLVGPILECVLLALTDDSSEAPATIARTLANVRLVCRNWAEAAAVAHLWRPLYRSCWRRRVIERPEVVPDYAPSHLSAVPSNICLHQTGAETFSSEVAQEEGARLFIDGGDAEVISLHRQKEPHLFHLEVRSFLAFFPPTSSSSWQPCTDNWEPPPEDCSVIVDETGYTSGTFGTFKKALSALKQMPSLPSIHHRKARQTPQLLLPAHTKFAQQAALEREWTHGDSLHTFRVSVWGVPGSGKSTLVRVVTAALSGNHSFLSTGIDEDSESNCVHYTGVDLSADWTERATSCVKRIIFRETGFADEHTICWTYPLPSLEQSRGRSPFVDLHLYAINCRQVLQTREDFGWAYSCLHDALGRAQDQALHLWVVANFACEEKRGGTSTVWDAAIALRCRELATCQFYRQLHATVISMPAFDEGHSKKRMATFGQGLAAEIVQQAAAIRSKKNHFFSCTHPSMDALCSTCSRVICTSPSCPERATKTEGKAAAVDCICFHQGHPVCQGVAEAVSMYRWGN